MYSIGPEGEKTALSSCVKNPWQLNCHVKNEEENGQFFLSLLRTMRSVLTRFYLNLEVTNQTPVALIGFVP